MFSLNRFDRSPKVSASLPDRLPNPFNTSSPRILFSPLRNFYGIICNPLRSPPPLAPPPPGVLPFYSHTCNPRLLASLPSFLQSRLPLSMSQPSHHPSVCHFHTSDPRILAPSFLIARIDTSQGLIAQFSLTSKRLPYSPDFIRPTVSSSFPSVLNLGQFFARSGRSSYDLSSFSSFFLS